MTKKWHINNNGDAKECHANKRACRFGGDDLHGNTPEQAARLYEQSQDSQLAKSLSKTSSGSEEPHPGELVKDYIIAEENIDYAKAIIDKANKKLERFGITERFEYSIEEYDTEIESDDGISRIKTSTVMHLNRPTLSYGEFQFVATAEDEEAGIITRTARGEDLQGWSPSELSCDHCGKNRHRGKTYIVRKGDKVLQVGRSCAEGYLGISPSGLEMMHWNGYEEHLQNLRKSKYSGSSSEKVKVSSEDVLVYALALSDEGKQFKTRNVAEQYGGISTAEKVQTLMMGRAVSRDQQAELQQAHRKAQELRGSKRVKDLLKLTQSLPQTSDYGRNIATVGKSSHISERNIALLSSIIAVDNNQKRKGKEEQQFKPGFAGAEGEKIKGKKAKIVKNVVSEDLDYHGYGITRSRVVMVDEEGHQMIWWASKEIEAEEGDSITFTGGSVKKHGQFNNIDQTVVTRVKFEKDS